MHTTVVAHSCLAHGHACPGPPLPSLTLAPATDLTPHPPPLAAPPPPPRHAAAPTGWDEPLPPGFAPVTPQHKPHTGPRASGARPPAARAAPAPAAPPNLTPDEQVAEGPVVGEALDWNVEWQGKGSLQEAPGGFAGAAGRGGRTRAGSRTMGTGGHPRPRSPAPGARVGKHEFERHDGTGRG